MPKHKDLLELISNVGGALATTSANLSGKTPLLNYDDVYATFAEKALVIPGTVSAGVASTVIACTGEKPKILSKGPLSIK